MKKIKISVVVSILCLFSCQKNEMNSNVPFRLKIGVSESTEMDFSQFLQIGDILPLKQKMGDPLGIIDKIQIEGNRIYVLDRQRSNALFSYDMLGNPIKKITTEGNGPGEVGIIWDFEVYPEDDLITVISSQPSKQINFDKEGNFFNESNLKFKPLYCVKLQNNIDMYEVAPFGNNRYFHWAVHSKIDRKEVDITSNEAGTNRARRATSGGFKKLNNEIFSLPTLSNKIYKLDKNGAREMYKLDLGLLTPSYDRFSNNETNMARGLSFVQSDEFMIISYATMEQGFHVCVLNTKTNNYKVGPLNGEKHFSSLTFGILRNTIYADDNGFIASIPSHHVSYWKKMLQEDHKDMNDLFVDVCKTREQLETIDPSDNVLVRFKVNGI